MLSCCVYVHDLDVLNDTATTEIYTYLHTLSLHDALPTCRDTHNKWVQSLEHAPLHPEDGEVGDIDHHLRCIENYDHVLDVLKADHLDRKRTRLNSSP